MIKMIRGSSIKEVTDEKLVKVLERKGWERADAPVKATLKKPKTDFIDVQEDFNEEAEETPAQEEASIENAINEGD